MERFVVKTHAETAVVAKKLADSITAPTLIAFTGDLGAGKTTFTRYFVKALGSDDEVTSPTFAMVHEYRGGRLPVYHFDMYRVEGYEALFSTGYYDYLDTGVLMVEWSENIAEELPEQYISVALAYGENEGERMITIGEIK